MAFSHWNTHAHAFRVARGCYGIGVGDSSAHQPLHLNIPRGGGSC
jgi:hypothetical protein